MSTPAPRSTASTTEWEQVAVVDLLDRVLATGVVVYGDITLSIAGIDLVHLSLHALLASVRAGGPGPIPATDILDEGPP